MKSFQLLAFAWTMKLVAASTTNNGLLTKCSRHHISASALLDNNDRFNLASTVTRNKKSKVMSKAIPFLACPALLVESNLAGNAGFDPLGFVQNPDDLSAYREAEIKHARLAMLVGVFSASPKRKSDKHVAHQCFSCRLRQAGHCRNCLIEASPPLSAYLRCLTPRIAYQPCSMAAWDPSHLCFGELAWE